MIWKSIEKGWLRSFWKTDLFRCCCFYTFQAAETAGSFHLQLRSLRICSTHDYNDFRKRKTLSFGYIKTVQLRCVLAPTFLTNPFTADIFISTPVWFVSEDKCAFGTKTLKTSFCLCCIWTIPQFDRIVLRGKERKTLIRSINIIIIMDVSLLLVSQHTDTASPKSARPDQNQACDVRRSVRPRIGFY